jgi:hypothetical protein
MQLQVAPARKKKMDAIPSHLIAKYGFGTFETRHRYAAAYGDMNFPSTASKLPQSPIRKQSASNAFRSFNCTFLLLACPVCISSHLQSLGTG